jgi:hypothetical protein
MADRGGESRLKITSEYFGFYRENQDLKPKIVKRSALAERGPAPVRPSTAFSRPKKFPIINCHS